MTESVNYICISHYIISTLYIVKHNIISILYMYWRSMSNKGSQKKHHLNLNLTLHKVGSTKLTCTDMTFKHVLLPTPQCFAVSNPSKFVFGFCRRSSKYIKSKAVWCSGSCPPVADTTCDIKSQGIKDGRTVSLTGTSFLPCLWHVMMVSQASLPCLWHVMSVSQAAFCPVCDT